MAELLRECNSWRSSMRTEARCTLHSFDSGLQAAASAMAAADVLVTAHGSGMFNALQMHAGASLVEVLPVSTNGCPCDQHKGLFASERKLRHYLLRSLDPACTNATVRQKLTYNRPVHLPWEVLRSVLDDVMRRPVSC